MTCATCNGRGYLLGDPLRDDDEDEIACPDCHGDGREAPCPNHLAPNAPEATVTFGARRYCKACAERMEAFIAGEPRTMLGVSL